MPLALAERRLIASGAGLVLLGMLVGLVVGQFPHAPMLLSAHLIGAIAVTLLIAVGAALHKLALTDTLRGWLVWTLAGSGYLNLVATVLGAALGTHLLTPIKGTGTAGMPAEALVGLLLVAVVGLTFASLGILLRGALASGPER
jgi:hypothetical protein